MYKSFFSNDSVSLATANKTQPNYNWYISADKIFKSRVKGLEEFSNFFGMEFNVSRFSVFDRKKSFDTAVLAENIKIYMSAGGHCAMIQGHLTKSIVIPKITIKKTTVLTGKIEILETKEFLKCVIQSFSLTGDIVFFSFSYSSYSDFYTDFNKDGTTRGTAGVKIDLTKWEVENS